MNKQCFTHVLQTAVWGVGAVMCGAGLLGFAMYCASLFFAYKANESFA